MYIPSVWCPFSSQIRYLYLMGQFIHNLSCQVKYRYDIPNSKVFEYLKMRRLCKKQIAPNSFEYFCFVFILLKWSKSNGYQHSVWKMMQRRTFLANMESFMFACKTLYRNYFLVNLFQLPILNVCQQLAKVAVVGYLYELLIWLHFQEFSKLMSFFISTSFSILRL